MSFGYATGEFEVTEERLGVYRPEEHIDNPKDYADNVDATVYDRRLRGPVDPRELQVDPRTGLKNYIANEQGGWTTSTAYIRRSLRRAIELGRQGHVNDQAMHEALRLLGQSLHTLEDLGAHSNWVELALIELGYTSVFPHVGTATQISVGGKRIWPLVTGTFGGTDFIHSLLGEATDKISQTSLTDLKAAVSEADMNKANATFDKLKSLTRLLPGTSSDLDQLQQSGQSLQQYHLQGTDGPGIAVTAQEIAQKIYPILELRDKIMKGITEAIEMVPGLSEIVDEITNALTVFVLSMVQPFLKPIMILVSQNVTKGTALVMSDEAQYLVWRDPHSSDPTHSMLSKDHFSCYLNDPAGQLAKVIIRHAVTEVVATWSDASRDIDRTIDSIVSCFCHPALLNRSWKLHQDMFAVIQNWVAQLPPEKKSRIMQGLTSDGVRRGEHHDNELQGLDSHSHAPQDTSRRAVGFQDSAAFTREVHSYTQSPATGIGPSQTYAPAFNNPSGNQSTSYEEPYRQWPYNVDYNRRDEESTSGPSYVRQDDDYQPSQYNRTPQQYESQYSQGQYRPQYEYEGQDRYRESEYGRNQSSQYQQSAGQTQYHDSEYGRDPEYSRNFGSQEYSRPEYEGEEYREPEYGESSVTERDVHLYYQS